jgi:NADH-quinone oxidoreductase subunit M
MIALLVLVPLLGGLALYAVPRRSEVAAKWLAVAISGAVFVLTAVSGGAPDVSVQWLSRPFVSAFHFGLGHGASYWIALLLGLTTVCSLVAAKVTRLRDFSAQMLVSYGAMLGVFLARDLLAFALFWDLMLIPVFLILLEWGSSRNNGSAWRYLIYNLSGGLALLLATAAFGVVAGTTDVIGKPLGPDLAEIGSVWGPWVFAGFALAFAIKTPIWPFHTWMPATYTDLPAPAVAVVGAVQSKAGLYGFLVIGLGLFPTYMHAATGVLVTLGLVGLFYGGFIALVSDDAKLVVGYSSLSHLGLMVIAIAAGNQLALGGALVYIVAHGLFTAGLFIVLGAIEQREETRSLKRLGGLAEANPRLAGAVAIMTLAALGLPGLAGFAGEILILTGLYQAGAVWVAILALIPVVLAAAYMLRIFQGIMHGPEHADLPVRADLSPLEFASLAPLAVALVLLGVDPGPLAGAVNATGAALHSASADAAVPGVSAVTSAKVAVR